MNKILSGVICLAIFTTFTWSPIKVSANTVQTNDPQIQLLLQLIVLLQSQLATLLQKQNPGNIVKLQDVNQSDFSLIVKGTPLEGRVLNVTDNYTFTDGGGGIDTVIYKKNRSAYNIYKGQSIPSRGYKNPIVVVGIDPYFIQVDVNSEFVRFADQTLTIPDLKVVEQTTVQRPNIVNNLSIFEIFLSLPNGIGHTSLKGKKVPNQTVSVELKNNSQTARNQSDKNEVSYTATLYEIKTTGKKINTKIKTSGTAPLSNSNAYSYLVFDITGGLEFNGDFERSYQLKVEIDTDGDSSSFEVEGWSDAWMVDYYKG